MGKEEAIKEREYPESLSHKCFICKWQNSQTRVVKPMISMVVGGG
jgi:hypothetical protein